MKIGSVILGFVMICVGVVDLAGQAPVLGIHPAVWFILGILLICSDSAWEKLAKKKSSRKDGEPSSANEKDVPKEDGSKS